jgi:hypothetical protein
MSAILAADQGDLQDLLDFFVFAQKTYPDFPPNFTAPWLTDPTYVSPYHGNGVIIVNWILMPLALFFVTARLYVRSYRGDGKWGWDDWLIVPATIGTFMFAVTSSVVARGGCTGHHIYDCSVPALKVTWRYRFAILTLYLFSANCLKLSITAFCLRLAPPSAKIYRKVVIGTIIFIFCTFVGALLTAFLTCRPAAGSWNIMVRIAPTTTCITEWKAVSAWSVIMSITDVWLMFLPITLVAGMYLRRGAKIGLIAIFCLGAFATAGSITKVSVTKWAYDSWDQSWKFIPFLIGTAIELMFGLTVACLPALSHLVISAGGTGNSEPALTANGSIMSQSNNNVSTMQDPEKPGSMSSDTHLGDMGTPDMVRPMSNRRSKAGFTLKDKLPSTRRIRLAASDVLSKFNVYGKNKDPLPGTREEVARQLRERNAEKPSTRQMFTAPQYDQSLPYTPSYPPPTIQQASLFPPRGPSNAMSHPYRQNGEDILVTTDVRVSRGQPTSMSAPHLPQSSYDSQSNLYSSRHDPARGNYAASVEASSVMSRALRAQQAARSDNASIISDSQPQSMYNPVYGHQMMSMPMHNYAQQPPNIVTFVPVTLEDIQNSGLFSPMAPNPLQSNPGIFTPMSMTAVQSPIMDSPMAESHFARVVPTEGGEQHTRRNSDPLAFQGPRLSQYGELEG